MICVEAITKGQAVYQTSAGLAGVADANAGGKQQFRGIALSGGGIGQAIDVCIEGELYGFTLAGNHDSLAYLSDTAGALADAAGTMTVNAGRVWAVPDNPATKVLRILADEVTDWS